MLPIKSIQKHIYCYGLGNKNKYCDATKIKTSKAKSTHIHLDTIYIHIKH